MNELTALEAEMLEKYTGGSVYQDEDKEFPETHQVFLHVGAQFFFFTRPFCEDMERVDFEDSEQVEWMRKMLAKALAELVIEQRGLDDCILS